MLAKQEPNKLNKIQSSSLSPYLISKDSRGLSGYLSSLSVRAVHEAQHTRSGIEDRLDTLRNSWDYWNARKDHEQRDEFLNEIEKEAIELKEALAEVPEFRAIAELVAEDPSSSDNIELHILKLIVDLQDSFSISYIMGAEQMLDLAYGILNDFSAFSLDEIALCFYRAKNGEFGTVFSRLDRAVVMEWLHTYMKRKTELRRDLNDQVHASSKGGDLEGKSSDWDLMRYRVVSNSKIAQATYKAKRDHTGERYFEWEQ